MYNSASNIQFIAFLASMDAFTLVSSFEYNFIINCIRITKSYKHPKWRLKNE